MVSLPADDDGAGDGGAGGAGCAQAATMITTRNVRTMPPTVSDAARVLGAVGSLDKVANLGIVELPVGV